MRNVAPLFFFVVCVALFGVVASADGVRPLPDALVGVTGAGPFQDCGAQAYDCHTYAQNSLGALVCYAICQHPGLDCCRCTTTNCGKCDCEWDWSLWCEQSLGTICVCGFIRSGVCDGSLQCVQLGAPSTVACPSIWATCCDVE